jgi:energy-coupling factor transport system substrate-specific component
MAENLHRFLAYTLITSTGSFDTGRAITNAVAIVVLGPAVLATLRRAARRVVVTGVVAEARSIGSSAPRGALAPPQADDPEMRLPEASSHA